MNLVVRVICLLAASLWGGMALAQQAWVQIEAQPSLREGEARARSWAETFPNVAGFAMSTGWYAIAIGPFNGAEAESQAQLLRGERLIPSDSYVSDGRNYRQQFWPVGAAVAPTAPQTPAALPQTAITPEPDPAPTETPVAPVETLAQARASEAALTRAEREALQAALQWEGVYTAAIDGSFGQGTRRSMAAWQTAMGHEPTGVLSTAQRAQLLDKVTAERAALGLELVTDTEAGIEVQMPMGLVQFDHYDPPFVHYAEKAGSGVRILLISQQGDQNTLFGLYDVMQTLEIVPLEGARERSRTGFVLTGQNAQVHSHTEVGLRGGLIKGFTLIYPAANATRMERVLAAMRASFRPLGDRALDDTLGKPLAEPRADLLAGLDVRKPVLARSGFYIDAGGTVLTAAAGLADCARITVEDADFDLAFADGALGIAVLRPRAALAPMAAAEFQTTQPRPNAEIAVSGFPYPDALSAPVLTFGKLSAPNGLDGEPGLARLALSALAGDAGGPVLDATGAVVGMLLPRPEGGTRLLPTDLALALQAGEIATVLAEKGFSPAASARTGALAAEDLALLAQGMTVQVACWN